ncbi:MAG: hypothetical protein IJG02_09290, partial [Thermoguttaceae bacterium]|nr:hypothetical protein [Thermoguttaceae bacterium]
MKRSVLRRLLARRLALGVFVLSVLLLAASFCLAGDLYVGAASVDITPDRPVLLQGQFHTRIATSAATPITANVIALEAREGEKPLDCAILVSID